MKFTRFVHDFYYYSANIYITFTKVEKSIQELHTIYIKLSIRAQALTAISIKFTKVERIITEHTLYL